MSNQNNQHQTNILKKRLTNDQLTRYAGIGILLFAMGFIGLALWNSRPQLPMSPQNTPTPIIPTATAPPIFDITTPYETLIAHLSVSVVRIEARPRRAFALPQNGTGSIITADGLVLTNAHVIAFGDVDETAMTAYITRGNRAISRGTTVVGVAPCDDIALLKMQGSGYIPLRYEEPDPIRLGAEVFLLGYGQTTLTSEFSLRFARGEISRPRTSFSPFQRLIEHTANLLPADSGSPLFNRRGQFIGMNFAMDVIGRGTIAYAIDHQRIQAVLAYLQAEEAPPANHVLQTSQSENPQIHRLLDYFDRHCYTVEASAEHPLIIQAIPQAPYTFRPMLSVYSPQNQLLESPIELTAGTEYRHSLVLSMDGRYTVVIARRAITTTGADKLGYYQLNIRQDN